MKKKLLSITIIVVLLTSVYATAFANYFAEGRNNIATKGASAQITYNSKPAVYNNSMVSAWSMICNTGHCLAQTGWAIDLKSVHGSNVYYFFGYRNTDMVYHELYTAYGPAIGSSHVYRASLDSSTLAEGYIDYVKYFNVTINWTPNWNEYAGEVLDWNAQMPGKGSLHEVFSDIKMLNSSGSWVTPSLSSYADYPGTTSGVGSSGRFEIWDARY